MKSLIKKYPLLSFVILTYTISWGFIYPSFKMILSSQDGIPPLAFIGIIGQYGPSLVALFIVGICYGREGIGDLWRKVLLWRIPAKWYGLALILPTLIYLTSLFVTQLFGFAIDFNRINWQLGLTQLFPAILLALPFGPMGEELGWRGYLLPELSKKYSWFVSTIIVGLVWTFWHAASVILPGATLPSVFELSVWTVLLYLLMTIAQSFFFTYTHIPGRGSVLLAIVWHASINASSTIVLTFVPNVVENPAHEKAVTICNAFIMLAVGLTLNLFHQKNRVS